MQILTNIALAVIAILLFELIIGLHEFGHFITAKLSGIKVNEFALGMGPKLCGFKKGETQYSLRLLPIGGFCAMEGEDQDSDEPRAFNNAKIWKRMIVVVAGAFMNILLGFILMFVFVMQFDSFSSTTVSAFQPNSYTANCDLQIGDKVVKVNDYKIKNSRDLSFSFAAVDCKSVDGKSVEVYKQDCASAACDVYRTLAKTENINDEQLKKIYTILSDGCLEINKVSSKENAKTTLDKICKDMYSYMNITDFKYPEIVEKDTRERYIADLTVIRDGKEIVLKDIQFFTFYADEQAKKDDKKSVALDFYVEPIEKTLGTVFEQTISQTVSVARMVWTSLAWIIQGRFGFKDMSGPVGIASAVTQVASQGLETSFLDAVMNILFVMILITINLGMFNMLPFPALDGGRFVLLLIEGIFKKPIPRKAEKYINAVGFMILLTFMFIVSIKDVWQLFTGQMKI